MARLNTGLGALAAVGDRVTELETAITETATRVAPFSQPSEVAARLSTSGKFIAPAAGRIVAVHLSATTAPLGGPATVECLLDGEVFLTTQLLAGFADTQHYTEGLPEFEEWAELQVRSTAVGTTAAVQGLAVQMELMS